LWRIWEPVVSRRVIAIDAATVYTPRVKFSPGRIIIDGESIVDAGPLKDVHIPSSADRIDATRFSVAPGFIEPHIHGCGGVDVMTGTFDSLNVVSRIVARHGTASFLPTTVTSPPEVLTTAIAKLGGLVNQAFDGAQPLGLHLEGPFINANRKGTHKAAHIIAPDPELLERWVRDSQQTIRLVTIAPELDPHHRIAALASLHRFRVAMGHSNANYAEAVAASDHGVRHAVHTFNAMRAFSHRDPGIVGAVLSDDRIFAEVIADGIHVDPAVVRFFARAKTAERVLLVTDAISATDMPDGDYRLGQDLVSVRNGACRDADGHLAGSTLTQEVALKNFIAWTGFSIQDALLALTENPARALGLHAKGVIESGADADLAVFDEDFHVMKTFVAGKLVFEREKYG
jgi:N-acetylglucosamine-6-phosphate deacetylase